MHKIAVPDIFDKLPVKAFFTTRAFSSSEFRVQSSEFKDRIPSFLNVSFNSTYLPIQKHTDKVLVIDHDFEPKIADAVITNRKNVLIGIQAADCVPILLYDAKKGIAGAVHAGWRGTASGILKKTIKAMTDRFCSSPADVLIAIGPSIRWCCYNVGHEVIEAVSGKVSECQSVRVSKCQSIEVKSSKDYIIKKGEKYCLDLPTANKYQALFSDVLLENIWMSDECTFCLPEKYYSYRYAKGTTGRQHGFIGMSDVL